MYSPIAIVYKLNTYKRETYSRPVYAAPLFSLSSLGSPATEYPSTTDPNIVSYWFTDEGSGTNIADSVGSNDLTLYNGTWWGITPPFDYSGSDSVVYNGSSTYADVASDADFQVTVAGAFSVSTWIYINSGSVANRAIIGTAGAGGSDRGFSMRIMTNGKIRFGVVESGSVYSVKDTQVLPTDQWLYICGTYSNTDVNIYVNGALDNDTAAAAGTLTTLSPATDQMHIGASSDGIWYMAGKIGLTIFYDDERSAAEVLSDYNNWVAL